MLCGRLKIMLGPKILPFPANVSRNTRTQVTPQKVMNFLNKLDIRVFNEEGELDVLSVYLDCAGSICVDVDKKVPAKAKVGAH